MQNRTIQEAFNAIFHSKASFEEFRSLDAEPEITEFTYKSRTVYKTSDKLKSFLKFINKVILRYLEMNNDVVNAFTKGKNTFSAVNAHTKNRYYFTSDITNFYSSIRTADVRRILENNITNIPISDFENYVDLVTSYTTYADSLPVGFVTSPQLSNAFLYEFDNELHEHCKRNNLIYTRYADDLIISGHSFESVSKLKDTLNELLNSLFGERISLNHSKTRITHLGNKVKILGLVILPNGRVTIDRKYKLIIESLLHFYVTDRSKYEDLLQREFDGNSRSLFGLLHYAKTVDPEYLVKLQKRYGFYGLHSLMASHDEP
jgi:RNA-directed DNA polymerase